MEIKLSVAGKTFLAGEYLALYGGPALVVATDPRFELRISDRNKNDKNKLAKTHQFHTESPAGKFLKIHQDFFIQYNMEITDPYKSGGFGASTAQFALLHAFWQMRDRISTESQDLFDWHEMIQDYREIAFSGKGFPPSGADLMGMAQGGLTWFERNTGNVQKFSWPFLEMNFMLLKTPRKLATHEHLAELTEFDTEPMTASMEQVRKGLAHVNWVDFIQGIKEFRNLVAEQGWLAKESAQLISELEAHSQIELAKGCGAMGADVIAVFFKNDQFIKVQSLAMKLGLLPLATSSSLSQGLEIVYSTQGKEVRL